MACKPASGDEESPKMAILDDPTSGMDFSYLSSSSYKSYDILLDAIYSRGQEFLQHFFIERQWSASEAALALG